VSWANAENKKLVGRGEKILNKIKDHTERDKFKNSQLLANSHFDGSDEQEQQHQISMASCASSSSSKKSIIEAIKKTFTPKKRKKNADSNSTAYGSLRSDSISSDDVSGASVHSIDSFSQSESSNDEIENELFLRRLFKNLNFNTDSKSLETLKNNCQIKTINNSSWQCLETTHNNTLFIELGHTSLNSMSRHDIVDLIDQFIVDDKIHQIIFFYNKNRSDAENLCKVFNLMDFQKIFSQQLQVSQMQTNQFLLNDINSYWVYDTLKQESGESDVFSDDDDEDFF
jgi:hypothetical protein